jgi:hypothetical protein
LSLFHELKRRNIFRAGAAYVVTAWVIIQIVETILPAFGFGIAAVRIAVIILAIGFVPAIILAWVFELTPDGIKREEEVDYTSAKFLRFDKTLDRLIIVVLVLAVGFFTVDKFLLAPQKQADKLEQAREMGREEARSENRAHNSELQRN